MRMRWLKSTVALFLMTVPVFAELAWETTTRDITVHPLQTMATISFGFTNTGDNAVTILEMQSECGCISGMSDKTTVQPGESGMVKVRFNLRGRTGPQEKGVWVVTDADNGASSHLTVRTTIPAAYDLSPRRLDWGRGEAHDSKICSMINLGKIPLPIERAESPVPGVTVELKAVREGFAYEVVVTPAPGVEKIYAPIIIHPEKPDGLDEVKTYTLYAAVW